MKNYFLILLTLVTVLSSCKKEPTPETPPIFETIPEYELFDIDWVVSGGYVYVENMDDNTYTFFNHFGSQDTTSLHVFEGSALPFDNIVVDETTWNFNTDGKFTLNNSIEYDYEFYRNGFQDEVFTLIGQIGGTARPIQLMKLDGDKMVVLVNETYWGDVITDTQYRFATVLTLTRNGSACNCNPDPYADYGHACESLACGGSIFDGSNYEDGGDLDIVITPPSESIYDTKWIVTKVVSGFATDYPNDTLHFSSYYNGNGDYTLNDGSDKYYRLSNVPGSNMLSLMLASFTPLNGDWEGQIQDTYLQDGEINNIQFNDQFSSKTAKVWMVRIQ